MQIWHRLIWREFRESSPFVLIGVLLPLVCLAMRQFQGEMVYVPIVIVSVVIAVWASARAREQRDAGLPLTVPLRLASRYLLPLPGVTLIGISLGCLAAFRLFETSGPEKLPIVTPEMILLVVGRCMFVYALCTVIASVYALIPAIVAGLVLAMFSYSDVSRSLEMLWVQFFLLLVLIVTAVLWEEYGGKHQVSLGRCIRPIMLGLLALIVGWGMLCDREVGDMLHIHDLDNLLQVITFPEDLYVGFNTSNNALEADKTLVVGIDYQHNRQIYLLDQRIPRRYVIAPGRLAPPGDSLRYLSCLDRHLAFFAAQAPHDAQVRVIAWDARTGQISERFRFTGWRGMIMRCVAAHSPDKRYLLLAVSSAIGWGDDCWLLDLPSHRATLLAPEACDRSGLLSGWLKNDDRYNEVRSVSWTPDRVILQLELHNCVVDLRTQRVSTLGIAGTP